MPEGGSGLTGQLREFSREARAWARKGRLMYLSKAYRTRQAGAPRFVIFVHGYGAGAEVFDPMRRRIEQELPVETASFAYRSHWTFERTMERFRERMEGVGPEREVDLVGHSLGGLVSRWYLQEMGGAERVRRLVVLATPHAGTRVGYIAPGPLGRVLQPDSHIVRRLEESRPRVSHIEHTALVAGRDVMVPHHSAGALADSVVHHFDDLGHSSMLFDDRVHRTVIDALSG